MSLKNSCKELRLQVALAQMGFASRRGAAELIKSGRVKVNGIPVLIPGRRVDLEKDKVIVSGRKSEIEKKVYYILNKPKGVVTTVKDKYAGRTVLDIIKVKCPRIYPVGRLDKDTSGLLLLTNDGELAYHLTHPKFGVKKVYRVGVTGGISQGKIRRLEKGILIEGKRTYPCKIEVNTRQKDSTKLEVHLTEGRNRQIKKMFAAVGYPVTEIHRIAFGPLKLTHLESGNWRPLNAQEIMEFKKALFTREHSTKSTKR